MLIKDDRFFLQTSCCENVQIERGDHYFNADLNYSPGGISLTIRGEEHGTRMLEMYDIEVDKLYCYGKNKFLTLYGLKKRKSRESALGSDFQADRPWYVEIEYSVSYFLVSKNGFLRERISKIKIFSGDIARWVGLTEKQKEIASLGFDAYKSDGLVGCVLLAGKKEHWEIAYNLQIFEDLGDFSAGIKFPPSFDVFIDGVEGALLLKKIREIFSFLFFLLGFDAAPDRVELSSTDSSEGSIHLYFPCDGISDKTPNRFPTFPLAHKNLRGVTFGSPLPLDVFDKFYSLEGDSKAIFRAFQRYSTLESVEEKYLGYFRLLEKLTRKTGYYVSGDTLKILSKDVRGLLMGYGESKKDIKSFLGGLKRVNGSKYNTEKCFSDFRDSLPLKFLDECSSEYLDMGMLCAFRNDIVHENGHVMDEGRIFKYATFMRFMLIFAISKELLCMSFEFVLESIKRDRYYFLIKR